MKKTILLMLGLAITTASFANDSTPGTFTDLDAQIRLVTTSTQKVKLFIQPRQSTAQIMLKDKAGHSLYTSSNLDLKRGFSRQFDLSDLAAGTYQLIITDESETVTKTFVVQPVPSQAAVVLI